MSVHPLRHMRRLGRWKLALRLLITAWVAAFGWNRSDQPPTNPDPLPPIAKSAALREGAILYEKDGEPYSTIRAA